VIVCTVTGLTVPECTCVQCEQRTEAGRLRPAGRPGPPGSIMNAKSLQSPLRASHTQARFPPDFSRPPCPRG